MIGMASRAWSLTDKYFAINYWQQECFRFILELFQGHSSGFFEPLNRFWTFLAFRPVWNISTVFRFIVVKSFKQAQKLWLEKQPKKVPNAHKSIEKVQKDLIDLSTRLNRLKLFFTVFKRFFPFQKRFFVTLTVKVFFDDNTDKSERHKLISLKYWQNPIF